jgi:RimJ/RimL family protein N-acetyltransferase
MTGVLGRIGNRRTPPARFELEDGSVLRRFTVDDGAALARAVSESLQHLRPWMPWAADAKSCEAEFQRTRLAGAEALAQRRVEWQYGLFPADESRVLGSFGLMTRRGPGTIEIGYWLHADALGHGHATRAAGALADAAARMRGVDRVLIYCDEANERSAAIPRRLGFTLVRTERRPPEAPAETEHIMVFMRRARDRR